MWFETFAIFLGKGWDKDFTIIDSSLFGVFADYNAQALIFFTLVNIIILDMYVLLVRLLRDSVKVFITIIDFHGLIVLHHGQPISRGRVRLLR